MLYTVPLWYGQNYDYYGTDFYSGEGSDNKMIHYTMVFNTFIMMNIFNQFNCRKIGWKEINIFDNFFNNLIFFVIVGGEFVLQYFIVSIGGVAFRTHDLSSVQWITCICFGLGSLGVGALIKFIPEQHSTKFAFNLSESEGDGNDAFSRITNKLTKPIEKSET